MVVPEVSQLSNAVNSGVNDLVGMATKANSWVIIVTMITLSFSWAVSVAQRIINGGSKE